MPERADTLEVIDLLMSRLCSTRLLLLVSSDFPCRTVVHRKLFRLQVSRLIPHPWISKFRFQLSTFSFAPDGLQSPVPSLPSTFKFPPSSLISKFQLSTFNFLLCPQQVSFWRSSVPSLWSSVCFQVSSLRLPPQPFLGQLRLTEGEDRAEANNDGSGLRTDVVTGRRPVVLRAQAPTAAAQGPEDS